MQNDALINADKKLETETGKSILKILAAALIGIFAIWFYCQLIPLLKLTLESSGWRLYVSIALLLVPVLALLWIAVYLWRLTHRLPKFIQLKATSEQESALKQKLQNDYLPKLPDPEEYVNTLNCKNPDQAKKLIFSLLSTRDTTSNDDLIWIKEFRRFQEIQESSATKIIKEYCGLIAIKTAACPWKILDMAIVFINTTMMVVKIARIYNRRISRTSAFKLVFHWFVNIYISGELGALAENVTTTAGEKIGSVLADNFKDSAGDVVGGIVNSMPFLAKLIGKTVEGGVNAYFAYRMGRKAIAEFQPVAF